MNNLYEKVFESTEFIKEIVKEFKPDIAVILGSGLGEFSDKIEEKIAIDYKDIPNFPLSTVEGHEGKLIFGVLNKTKILVMQGRFHYYEGYSMKEVTYPIYVMKELGIRNLIITNSCGGINEKLAPGSFMLINDFINLMGDNPLIGANNPKFGLRFPDMTEPYSLELLDIAKQIADDRKIKYMEGVYTGFMGPYYETAAEIRAIKIMGGDAVGMSTVPETIVANYLGIKVLGIACITNMATGIQKKKHSHLNVVDTAKESSNVLCDWINLITEKIYE